MLTRSKVLLAGVIQIVDLLLVALTFESLWSASGTGFLPSIPTFLHAEWVLPTFLLVYYFTFRLFGLYEFNQVLSSNDPTHQVFRTSIVAGIVCATLLYFSKTLISRTFILTFIVSTAVVQKVGRYLLMWALKNLEVSSNARRHILIVGPRVRAVQFVQAIQQNQGWGYEIVGIVDTDSDAVNTRISDVPILGTLDNLDHLLRAAPTDEVLVCLPRQMLEQTEKPLQFCQEAGISVHIVLDFFSTALSSSHLEDFFGIPILSFRPQIGNAIGLYIKRLIDIVGALVGMIVLSPLLLGVMIAIKIFDPGPLFFGQLRCGLNKRRFTCWKFRTMVENADELKQNLAAENEMDGPVFKIKDDPRITPLGRFLRKYSLDEFPQLWNVLVGDMSLVGPRPPTPDEVDKYERWQLRRLSMRPGLSCIWQISGRSLVGFRDWMKMDLYYIDNWSLWLDLKIILQTIPVVLTGKGAY